jgi:hypothetical protein
MEHRPSPVYLPPSKGKEATRTVGEVRGAPGPVFVPQPPVRDVAAEARRTRQAEFDSRISRTIEGIDRRRG